VGRPTRWSGPSIATTVKRAAIDWISRRKEAASKRPWPCASGAVFDVVRTRAPRSNTPARKVLTISVLPGSSSSNSSMQ
jgi:hypothetical protein